MGETIMSSLTFVTLESIQIMSYFITMGKTMLCRLLYTNIQEWRATQRIAEILENVIANKKFQRMSSTR